MITSLVFTLLSRSSNPEKERLSTDSKTVFNNSKQDSIHLENNVENSLAALEISSTDDLSLLAHSENIFCFRNSLFRCPFDKDLHNLQHLTTLFYENTNSNESGEIFETCPNCKQDLSSAFLEFKNEFIEYLVMNPQKELIDTLKIVLTNYDPRKIIYEIFSKNKISKTNLELLLELIDPINNRDVKNFKRIICETALYFEEENITIEIFENFCSEIRNKSDNVLELLSKNLENIKLFSCYQRTHMFELLLSTNFSDLKIRSDAIFYLYDKFSKSRLFWFLSETIKIKLSIFALEVKTIKGLKSFIALNRISFEITNHDENIIPKLLYSLFSEFGFKKTFFRAINVLNEKLDSNYSMTSNSKLLFDHASPDMIFTADYEFLLKRFGQDFILRVFLEYFTREETAEKAFNYYFQNIVPKTSCTIHFYSLIFF